MITSVYYGLIAFMKYSIDVFLLKNNVAQESSMKETEKQPEKKLVDLRYGLQIVYALR